MNQATEPVSIRFASFHLFIARHFIARRTGLAALLAMLALAGCRGPKSDHNPDFERIASPSTGPSWPREPLSWDKLEEIERWLAEESSEHDPGLRIEAVLQLNEGRLHFSRDDIDRQSAPSEAVRVRLHKALAGFEQVLREPSATPGQKSRAQIGQSGTRALLEAPARPGLSIVTRAQWGAQPPVPSRMTPLKGSWSRITVHHSADTISNGGSGTLEESAQIVSKIQNYHLQDPGRLYGDIGYHYLIDSAGRIFEGRELKWQGAHAGGINNNQNLGICLLGDFSRGTPTEAAFTSLQLLLDSSSEHYRIPTSRVFPHKRFSDTVCPGPALIRWLEAYR
jgi:hypothetical protein